MPRKKNEPKALLPEKVLECLWDEIDWYAVASDAMPQNRFIKDKAHIKGLCPYHSEEGVSFYITPGKRMAKCFGCDTFITNPVRLLAKLQGGSYGDALSFLKSNPSTRKFIPKSFVEESEKRDKHQELKGKVVGFCCDLLSQFVAMPAEELSNTASWAISTVEWLKERIPVDNALPQLAANRHIGILPPLAYFKEDPTLCQDAEAIAFATEYFRDNIVDKHDHIGALMLITQTDPSTIHHVKLRKREWTDPKVFAIKDDFADKPAGFLGLNFYRAFLGVRKPSNMDTVEPIAYVKEGEFDALHAMAHHLETYEYISLSAGGGSASAESVDRLADFGINKVCIVPDADNGGRNFAQRLLFNTRSKTLGIKIFEWPAKYLSWSDPSDPEKRIKDPDEAIRCCGYDAWARELKDAKNWREPHEWALDQLEHSLARFDDPSLHERTQAAKMAGACLKHPQERRQFCKLVAQRYSLDEAALHRELSVQDEGYSGFVERTKERLLERYTVLFADTNANKLVIWDTQKSLELDIPIDKKSSAVAKLANGCGSISTFIEEQVGEPAYVVDGDEAIAAPMLSNAGASAKQKQYEDVMMRVFESLMHDAPTKGDLPRPRQGFHYLQDPQQQVGHIVNGHRLWRLEWDAGKLKVEAMKAPRDGNVLFEPNREPWLELNAADDITKLRLDLNTHYDTILKILQTGWRFTHQELDCQFFAAYIMSLPVADIFPKPCCIHINGAAGSGKSSIVAGLIGGWQIPAIRLVVASQGFANLTKAALVQKTSGISHAVVLDEFENDGTDDQRSRAQVAILKHLNDQVTSTTGSRTVIGTVDGRGHVYHTRYPVILAGITPLTDDAAVTRYILFEMAKEKLERRHGDIQQALMKHWSAETFAKMRHDLSLGMYHYVPQLLEAYSSIGEETAKEGVLPSFVPARFKDALLPVLAMMKVIGLDYLTFARDFAQSRRDALMRAHGAGLAESIFDDVLEAPILLNGEGATTTKSLRQMLTNVGDLDAINRASKGVFIDRTQRWLMINWLKFQGECLKAFPSYRDRSVKELVGYARRSPNHVSWEVADKFDLLGRMETWIGFYIKKDGWTVFSVENIVQRATDSDAERRRAPQVKKDVPSPISLVTKAETVESGEGEGV